MEQFGGCFMGGGVEFDNVWIELKMYPNLDDDVDDSTILTVGIASSL